MTKENSIASPSRRKALKGAGVAAAATAFNFQVVPSKVFGANSKITLGAIGTGGKGASDIEGSKGAGFEIVSLCDVVDVTKYPNVSGRMQSIMGTRRKYPQASFYEDWREMLAAEGDKIDAVTVSGPDHMHAHATIAALKAGKNVYTQKPLTHNVWEARKVTEVAAETGLVTQMGNQAHALDSMRRTVELVQSGIIGDVREVHCWTNRPIWPQAIPAWPEKEAPPAHINWDLWLGPTPFVDYSSKIMPFNWRGYWQFGTGALGDMACHIWDMAYWSLDLGAPTSIEAVSGEDGAALTDISPPTWSTITFEFPERNGKPPVKFVWYDGYKDAVFNPKTWQLESIDNPGNRPQRRNLPPEEVLEGEKSDEGAGFGTVMIGDKGKLWFNRSKDNWVVKPSSILDGFEFPEQTIPRARGGNPHNEFYDACAANDPKMALSGAHHAGPYTEMVLLGNLAVRLNKKIEWDAKNLKATNAPEADALIKEPYRDGWDIGVS